MSWSHGVDQPHILAHWVHQHSTHNPSAQDPFSHIVPNSVICCLCLIECSSPTGNILLVGIYYLTIEEINGQKFLLTPPGDELCIMGLTEIIGIIPAQFLFESTEINTFPIYQLELLEYILCRSPRMPFLEEIPDKTCS